MSNTEYEPVNHRHWGMTLLIAVITLAVAGYVAKAMAGKAHGATLNDKIVCAGFQGCGGSPLATYVPAAIIIAVLAVIVTLTLSYYGPAAEEVAEKETTAEKAEVSGRE